jgi:hypothetical protein
MKSFSAWIPMLVSLLQTSLVPPHAKQTSLLVKVFKSNQVVFTNFSRVDPHFIVPCISDSWFYIYFSSLVNLARLSPITIIFLLFVTYFPTYSSHHYLAVARWTHSCCNGYTQQSKNFWMHCFLCALCHIKGESVGLSLYPPVVDRQWLGKPVHIAIMNCWRCHFLCSLCHIKGK